MSAVKIAPSPRKELPSPPSFLPKAKLKPFSEWTDLAIDVSAPHFEVMNAACENALHVAFLAVDEGHAETVNQAMRL